MKSNVRTVIEKRLIKALAKTMKDAPKVLGLEGQRAILENFKTESYEGKHWRLRIHRGKKENTKPILIGRTRKLIGAARRAFKGFNNSRLKWSIDGVPYAEIHNKGFRGIIYVKPHGSHTASIKTKVHGSSGFKYGKFTKGKSSTVHLQGGKTHVKGYSYRLNMPKRQFIGLSPKFINRLKLKFNQMLTHNLK